MKTMVAKKLLLITVEAFIFHLLSFGSCKYSKGSGFSSQDTLAGFEMLILDYRYGSLA
jgi:hypothetical protein